MLWQKCRCDKQPRHMPAIFIQLPVANDRFIMKGFVSAKAHQNKHYGK